MRLAFASSIANHHSENGSAACDNGGHLLLRHQLHRQRCMQQQQQLLTFSDGAAVTLHTYAAAVSRTSVLATALRLLQQYRESTAQLLRLLQQCRTTAQFRLQVFNEAEATRLWTQLPRLRQQLSSSTACTLATTILGGMRSAPRQQLSSSASATTPTPVQRQRQLHLRCSIIQR